MLVSPCFLSLVAVCAFFHPHATHVCSEFIFLGGDGLAYGRMIHLIKQNPMLWLQKKPVVIPQLGEHPHTSHHIMHAGWRQWAPLLVKIAEIAGANSIVEDPDEVKHFNKHEFFLTRIAVRACAEYVLEICQTGGSDWRLVAPFMRVAERSICFAIIVHFLYDFGFLYCEWRRARRQNMSHRMDILLRESLANFRHVGKTNYSQWTVSRIYWGGALREPLATAYHNLRTWRLYHSHVGIDMFVEKVNHGIAEDVRQPTQDRITAYLARRTFLHTVQHGVERLVPRAGVPQDKKVGQAVTAVKAWLKATLGSTWQAATSLDTGNTLNLDLAIGKPDWGGGRTPLPQNVPWVTRRAHERTQRQYVEDELVKMAHWHRWVP